ncbi:MAG: stage II sporulation protein D [Bacteroidetes bacterium]|nr:MAG: stage II sporulation protein D [Bacteroidota bacterium]
MKRKISVLFAACCSLPLFSAGADVTVRLLSDMKVSAALISVVSGKYELFADGKILPKPDSVGIFQLQLVNDSIEVRMPDDTLGRFKTFHLIPKSHDAAFKLKPVTPLSGTRMYFGELKVSSASQVFVFVHESDLEQYVAGVVESESGGYKVKEFYKVQAILCRTYALNHLGRHSQEGFELCDGVHCQVYRSRTISAVVQEAVLETHGLVLVDASLNLITAAFHSNCGGQTVSSEDLWTVALPYLRSTPDSFCTTMSNARWRRKIATEDWLSYLGNKHKYPVNDSIARVQALNFRQQARGVYYVDRSYRIPLRTLRSDWQLRSTFFSIEPQKDSLLFTGRGWGHAVGLCQEGAIRMAKKGYDYQYILNYYYRNVSMVNMSRLDFFRED